MAKPADCAHCQKTATIHLTQIIDGKITKLDFCEDCPHQKEVADPAAFSLAQLLSSQEGAGAQGGGIDPQVLRSTCSQCGMSLNAFKKTGRLGCAHCYEQFRQVIEQILPQMQSASEHTGKRPVALLERLASERRQAELTAQLKEAIRTEAYEEAARLRDELREFEREAAARNAAALLALADAESEAAAQNEANAAAASAADQGRHSSAADEGEDKDEEKDDQSGRNA